MSVGVVAPAAAATISTAAKLNRSVVGAVSLSCTTAPAIAVRVVVFCTQYVSPVGVLSHWCAIAWLAPSVRAVAPSQSLPTP